LHYHGVYHSFKIKNTMFWKKRSIIHRGNDDLFNKLENRFSSLKPDISWCRFLENVDTLGERLANQFENARSSFETMHNILTQKFNKNEITFGRYWDTASRSYSIILDQIAKIIPLLKNLDETPAGKKSHYDFEKKELVETILQRNEELIEKADILILELSKIKNIHGSSSEEVASILEDLKVLSDRTKNY